MAEPTTRTEVGTTAGSASSRRGLFASFGAVGAAFLASLCCIGPLLFVTLGVGAGLASAFEPLRPVFTAATVALLAVGFYVVYGKRPPAVAPDSARAPGEACVIPRNRTRDRVLLWVATVVALLLLTFPQWSLLLV